MYARIAHFEGADPSTIDADLADMKRQLEAARAGQMPDNAPPEAGILMETVVRWVELVDRSTGASVGIAYCETEDDARRADAALDAMSPPDGAGKRTSVGIYEVALDESFT
jgi:hypothetical protein